RFRLIRLSHVQKHAHEQGQRSGRTHELRYRLHFHLLCGPEQKEVTFWGARRKRGRWPTAARPGFLRKTSELSEDFGDLGFELVSLGDSHPTGTRPGLPFGAFAKPLQVMLPPFGHTVAVLGEDQPHGAVQQG